ncbi:MAG: hypothetical protein VYC56_07985 [Actinomycetota bacterium]|nr:hypothetical protein [Actinomycetota bacterium]
MRDRLLGVRAIRWAVGRPVLAVGLVAVVARAATAAVLNLMASMAFAPDAVQYLAIAEAASSGWLDSLWQGYGASLYGSTRFFSAQIAVLFEFVGPYRAIGQSVAVLYGVVTAVAVTSVALRVVRPAFALGAGLLVAILPSQVLWSSVVLRESAIWALLAVAAVLLERASGRVDRIRLALVGVGAACVYIHLLHLREQTAFLMLWAAVAALVLGVGRIGSRLFVVALVLVVAPLAVDRTVGELGFLAQSMDRLGTVRTYMAMGAESAIAEPEPVDREPVYSVVDDGFSSDSVAATSVPPTTVSFGDSDGGVEAVDEGAAGSRTPSAGDVLDRELNETERGQKFVIDLEGRAVAVHNELSASLEAFPRGLVAVTLRPFPWEDSSTWKRTLAGLESSFWFSLYCLAALGCWARRRDFAPIAYPSILIGVLLASAAVTQGNLGTAFRHRGQLLWALAILSAAGLQWWVDRARQGRTCERG